MTLKDFLKTVWKAEVESFALRVGKLNMSKEHWRGMSS